MGFVNFFAHRGTKFQRSECKRNLRPEIHGAPVPHGPNIRRVKCVAEPCTRQT